MHVGKWRQAVIPVKCLYSEKVTMTTMIKICDQLASATSVTQFTGHRQHLANLTLFWQATGPGLGWLWCFHSSFTDRRTKCILWPYLPTSRIGRGPYLSIRIPNGRVVALSRKEPMVNPRFSISSCSTQNTQSCAPSVTFSECTTTESFSEGESAKSWSDSCTRATS